MLLQLILLFAPASLAQYSGSSYGMKADLSFNEYNDRFDVEAMVKDQQRMYPEPKEIDDDFRRNNNNDIDFKRKEDSSGSSEDESFKNLSPSPELQELPVKQQFVPVLDMEAPTSNIEASDFAYHDKMESDYETDYEKHLKPFQRSRRNILYELMNELHGGKVGGRRNMEGVDPLKEVLFHHAVPVKISIDGFVELPQNLVE